MLTMIKAASPKVEAIVKASPTSPSDSALITARPDRCVVRAACLDAPCSPFAPFAGVDTAALADELEVDSAYAVAAGLAYRRLSE